MKKETKFGDRVFVFDADVAPYRTHVSLNHWLEFEEDLIFYDRTWNTEIMAGNYMAKNTNASQNFLMRWANYEFQAPSGFSSADNGAIHLHLVRALGLEPFQNGTCAQLYDNLTALVTDLGECDPRSSFKIRMALCSLLIL